MTGPTPSQTVGPFFSIGLGWPEAVHAADPSASGAIRIGGVVLDGDGEPVPDAMVETWQTDPPAGDGFRGFARCASGDDGAWEIVTLKPGAVPAHLAVSVFARGLLRHVVTRIYFPEDAAAHGTDPVLQSVPAERRGTLVAEAVDGGYRFDIRLQGPGETVFFAL